MARSLVPRFVALFILGAQLLPLAAAALCLDDRPVASCDGSMAAPDGPAIVAGADDVGHCAAMGPCLLRAPSRDASPWNGLSLLGERRAATADAAPMLRSVSLIPATPPPQA